MTIKLLTSALECIKPELFALQLYIHNYVIFHRISIIIM